MQEWYKDWFNSPYYHLLYSHRDEQEAALFIDRLLTFLKPSAGSRMLDIACGKGRHAFQLASKGFDVTGIDLSEASISEAKRQESDELHFYIHDMRQPFWINYFDYAFNFFTSFGYFNTQREHHDAIRTIAQSIKLNGLLIMDYLNAENEKITAEAESTQLIDNCTFRISKYKENDRLLKKIEVKDSAAGSNMTFMEKVAAFNLEDFRQMFLQYGLSIENTFGDYELHPFDKWNSPRLILIARKTGY